MQHTTRSAPKRAVKIAKTARRRAKTTARKPQDERWAEIIDAATEIFWERGYDAATLQDIAERVGILKGSIYYYIESKTDLRAHMLSEAHHDGLAMISKVAASEEEPLTRLYKVFVSHVFHVCNHMARTAVFLHEVRRLSEKEKAQIGVDDRAYSRVFQHCIEQAQAAGLLDQHLDPKLAALCALSALNATYTWYRPGGEFTPEQIARHLAATLLKGMASSKGLKGLAKMLQATAPP